MDAKNLEFPVRPYVPPTAFGALGTCLSSLVVLDGGWHRRAVSRMVPVAQIGALLIAAFLLIMLGVSCARRSESGNACLNRTLRAVMGKGMVCLGTGAIAGCLASSLWLLDWQARSQSLERISLGSCVLVVRGDPSIGEFGISSTVDVLDGASGKMRATVRMTADRAFDTGTKLKVVGRLRPLDESDWARSRFMKGEVASLSVVRVLDVDDGGARHGVGLLRHWALEAIEPERDEARALLAGTICGRTTELNEAEANEAFSRCGLSHLVAVSGSHLAFISMLFDAVLRKTHVRSKTRHALVLLVMVGYVAFTGFAPSAARSVVMVAAGMATGLFERRAHPLSGLALAVFVLVLFNPGIVYDLGFQLSALSVLFLLVFGRYAAYLLMRLGIPSLVAEPLSLTLVAQWATLPLTVPVFGEMSLVAPLANVVVGPVMSALLVVGLVAVPVATLPFGAWMLAIPDALARVSVFLADMFAAIPHASVMVETDWLLPVGAYGIALVAYVFWKDVRRRMLIAALALVGILVAVDVMRWSLFAPPSITVLDVGQADAILVRDGPHAMLVDAGVDQEAATALARNHVLRLDAVVVTHWDLDHWGGLPDILDTVSVDRIIVAKGAVDVMPEKLDGRTGEIVELAEGDVVHVGGFACEMVWPDKPVAGDENRDSLCLDVSYERDGKELDMLLTGDAERGELAACVREVGDIDVLKVGHHGSKVSLTEEILRTLKPEVALASAGEGNRYGHPHADCVRLIEDAGSLFLCTKDVGDITVCPGKTGPHIRTERDSLY